MDAVGGEASPPPELRLSWSCEKYNCLPDAGGYLDQDFRLMHRMTVLSNVYNAYNTFRNAHGKDIHNLSEATRRVLRRLKDMGLIFNASNS